MSEWPNRRSTYSHKAQRIHRTVNHYIAYQLAKASFLAAASLVCQSLAASGPGNRHRKDRQTNALHVSYAALS